MYSNQEGRRRTGSHDNGYSSTNVDAHHNRTSSGHVSRGSQVGGSGLLGQRQSHAQVPRPSYIPRYNNEPENRSTDAINQDILKRVKAKFDSADSDGSGRLQPQEFISAFLGILQTEDGGDAEALGKLFMRIDANSDGTIDWDEFSTYMLLESQGSARVREFESIVTMQQAESSPIPDHLAHKDAMTHITTLRLANGIDRYATCGRDGTVRLWNAKDLKPVKTLVSGGAWATCSAFMPLSQKLAVGSFSRSIRIFDLASYEVAGQIPEIDFVPLSLDVWVPPRAKDRELVVVGDGGGWVRLFEIRATSPEDQKNGNDRFTERGRWKFHHHTDWVMAVKYVADMNCVLAASLDKTVSITDAEERVPLKKLEGHHHKGVNAVDWSPLYKFVLTGSLDRRVIMWNPFSQKPLAVLHGHNAAVSSVVVNDRDNQIISLSTDHVIKIWDIRNHKCIQTLPDRELQQIPMGSDSAVNPAVFDQTRRQLVTGFNRPKVWKLATAGSSAAMAHSASVTRVMYNSNFHEAISADHAGSISVWHVPTGKLRYRFLHCHGDKRITALAFDAAKRRLITGAEDGDCKVWNFSSGACLSHMQSKTKTEVTALVPLRGPLTRYVLAAGWDRRITFYEDNTSRTVGPARALAGHKADILAMVALEGSSTVVTASDDGEVWVWNMDSCAPKRRMVAPLASSRPPNERAVEALGFLSGPGRLRSVLVAVGADRWMRFWDVLDGSLLLERFTGHKMGETVQALALDGTNARIATGDSGGIIKVWDMSGYTGGVLSQAAAAFVIREVAVWRGHKAHVTSLDWMLPGSSPLASGLGLAPGIAVGPPGAPGSSGGTGLDERGSLSSANISMSGAASGAAGGGAFLLSSSADCTVVLWSATGGRVGTFGQSMWSLTDLATWADINPPPLDERDTWVMEASRVIPRTDPSMPMPLDENTPEDSSVLEPSNSVRLPTARDSGLTPTHSAAARAGGLHLGGVLGSGGLSTRRTASVRPGSAPADIALVCEASNLQRVEHRMSMRRLMSRAARAGEDSGGSPLGTARAQASRNASLSGVGGAAGDSRQPAVGSLLSQQPSRLQPPGTARSNRLLQTASRGSEAAPAETGDQDTAGGAAVLRRGVSVVVRPDGIHEEYDSEEDGVASASTESTSDDHASDTEVPAALWLAEFDAARNSKLMPDREDAGSRAGPGTGPRGFGAGGRMGVAHLLKVSELTMLQERPATSYMSSRRGVATAAGVLTRSTSPRRQGTSSTSLPYTRRHG